MWGENRRTGGFNPNAPRQSMAITPTKRFTDLGPNSVRKSVAPRMSLSQPTGQPRTSVFSSRVPAQTRDVKALFAGNVAKIYNFLVENEGADAPPEKDIRAPSGKTTFTGCFELIYQHLSKNYEYPTGIRLEDEIPVIFKGLGYPFPLKNSYFQPMGSSHGYPHLVDALAWLVDLVKINQSVSSDTQNILFGDFMEPSKVQEKTLSYAWFSATFREYTNNRKAAEDVNSPFWQEIKQKLGKYFEDANDFDDMATNAKSTLEQLRFECDEIEAEKGNEQSLQEEIARIRDDIRKASEYRESTDRVQKHKQGELDEVQTVLKTKEAENGKVQAMIGELKERIEEQKKKYGLTGKEVRQMNLDNNRDKERVAEIQTELDNLSKQAWRLKDEDSFKEQKAKFCQLVESITKLISGLGIELSLAPLQAPSDERELRTSWETLNNTWLPEINRQLHQRKLELDAEKSRFADRFAATEERIQMETEMLMEAKKREAREERARRNEREEWKESRQQLEKKSDELDNELEILKKKLYMDGSLEKEIETEKVRMAKIEKEKLEQKERLETAIRQKLDEIMTAAREIKNEQTMFHKMAGELLKTAQENTTEI